MRIIYIGKYPYWYKHSFGGEEHIQRIAELMVKKGHEVYLVNSIYEGEKFGIKFKKLNYVYLSLAKFIEDNPFPLYPIKKEIKKLVEKIDPDIIHHFAKHGLSIESLRKKGVINIPTVNSTIVSRTEQTGYSLFGLLLRGKLYSFVSILEERYSLKNADEVITTSTALAEIISKECRIPIDEINVIPRGVDADKFESQPWDKVKRNLIFFAGRLEKEKGVRYIIKAMKYVLKEIPDAKLVIAGDGPRRGEFEDLAQVIAPENIQFLGRIHHEEMSEWYGKCNIFVMHSRFEPFGAVTVEAMASARPVVASRTGGSIDIVKNNETGILVEFGDVKGIADAIIKILKDEKLAKSMGEKGRRRIEENYSWEREADRIEEIYKELIT
jgi:glycosyltransferase involved in cell wall biosynthesis